MCQLRVASTSCGPPPSSRSRVKTCGRGVPGRDIVRLARAGAQAALSGDMAGSRMRRRSAWLARLMTPWQGRRRAAVGKRGAEKVVLALTRFQAAKPRTNQHQSKKKASSHADPAADDKEKPVGHHGGFHLSTRDRSKRPIAHLTSTKEELRVTFVPYYLRGMPSPADGSI